MIARDRIWKGTFLAIALMLVGGGIAVIWLKVLEACRNREDYFLLMTPIAITLLFMFAVIATVREFLARK